VERGWCSGIHQAVVTSVIDLFPHLTNFPLLFIAFRIIFVFSKPVFIYLSPVSENVVLPRSVLFVHRNTRVYPKVPGQYL